VRGGKAQVASGDGVLVITSGHSKGSDRSSMLGACISGVAKTQITRRSGKSVLLQAAEAISAAVRDAGLEIADIDGLATYSLHDSVGPDYVAMALGIPELSWSMDWVSGGSASAALIGYASAAIRSEFANNVVVYRALNGSSGLRMGGVGIQGTSASEAFTSRYGFGTAAQWAAMACQRHMAVYGTSPAALAQIAVRQRGYAQLNPAAITKGAPISEQDYFRSPFIAEPLRLYDCCQESDGAAAAVVSRSGRVGANSSRDVDVMSMAYTSPLGSEPPYEKYEDITVMFPRWLQKRLFESAGIGPEAIDLAYLYDAFTFSVLCQLEDFGFCPKGEGSDYVLEQRARPLVNTNGGLLSEGYIHGFNNLVEAVVQLRGEAHDRQADRHDIALVSGYGLTRGSAVVLSRAR
jgi:acetyl-CoA acetyltransferase